MSIIFSFKGGTSYVVLAMQTQDGAPLDVTRLIEEQLETAGLNGRRWRTVFEQHSPMKIRTIASAADFATAIVLAEAYLKSARRTRTLAITGSDGRNLTGLHISECAPVPVAGPLVSSQVTATGGASVVCLWTLEFTDVTNG